MRPQGTRFWTLLLRQQLQQQHHCTTAADVGAAAAAAAAAEAAAAAAARGGRSLLAASSSSSSSSSLLSAAAAAAGASRAAWRQSRQSPRSWGASGSSGGAAATAQRPYSTARSGAALFTPSRLYPKQQRYTAEDAAFWGIVAANVAGVMVAKREAPDARAFARDHLRASVAALYEGRWHTLATAALAHLSAVHCAINVGVLMFCRRTHQLAAGQLLSLYLAGCAVGTCAHVAWHWYDAAGPAYGARYALNTPAICGCSGGVAAVLGYKLGLAPAAMRVVVFVPVPLAFALFVYGCLEVREEEYCDGPPGKVAAAALGVLAALVTRGRGSSGGRRAAAAVSSSSRA